MNEQIQRNFISVDRINSTLNVLDLYTVARLLLLFFFNEFHAILHHIPIIKAVKY